MRRESPPSCSWAIPSSCPTPSALVPPAPPVAPPCRSTCSHGSSWRTSSTAGSPGPPPAVSPLSSRVAPLPPPCSSYPESTSSPLSCSLLATTRISSIASPLFPEPAPPRVPVWALARAAAPASPAQLPRATSTPACLPSPLILSACPLSIASSSITRRGWLPRRSPCCRTSASSTPAPRASWPSPPPPTPPSRSPGLGGELKPFQRAGVNYLLAQRRAFLADEQGLGKTIEALATLQADDAYPAVVVCPASLKLNWLREIERWLPARTAHALAGTGRRGAAAHGRHHRRQLRHRRCAPTGAADGARPSRPRARRVPLLQEPCAPSARRPCTASPRRSPPRASSSLSPARP